MPSISDLEPWFAAISAVLSVATLGFVVNLAKLLTDAAKARAEIGEDRLKAAKEDIEREQKWSMREREALAKENEALKQQVKDVLSSSGATALALTDSSFTSQLRVELRDAIDELIPRMRASESAPGDHGASDPDWNLQLGKAFAAVSEWGEAARYLDLYTSSKSDDWSAQYLRGVAHTNSRRGREADTQALRAYNEALAVRPETLGFDEQARLFGYRGAVLKRLARLDEAENDLQLARKSAEQGSGRMLADIRYNLAGVYAMRGDRAALLNTVKQLSGSRKYLGSIRAHLSDYFANFKEDQEFLSLL